MDTQVSEPLEGGSTVDMLRLLNTTVILCAHCVLLIQNGFKQQKLFFFFAHRNLYQWLSLAVMKIEPGLL